MVSETMLIISVFISEEFMLIRGAEVEDDLAELIVKLYRLEEACTELDDAKIKYEVSLDICYDLMNCAVKGGRMEKKIFSLSIKDAARRIRESICWIPVQAEVFRDYKKTPPGSLKLGSYIYRAVKPFVEKEFER